MSTLYQDVKRALQQEQEAKALVDNNPQRLRIRDAQLTLVTTLVEQAQPVIRLEGTVTREVCERLQTLGYDKVSCKENEDGVQIHTYVFGASTSDNSSVVKYKRPRSWCGALCHLMGWAMLTITVLGLWSALLGFNK
jgi:hypothetical protein